MVIVTNPTNPNFSLTATSNTSASYTITMGNGQWTYHVTGRLADPTRDGSITFQVDPPEQIVTQSITIRSSTSAAGGPAIGPWTLVGLGIGLALAGSFAARVRVRRSAL
jgi:hypothetical protein